MKVEAEVNSEKIGQWLYKLTLHVQLINNVKYGKKVIGTEIIYKDIRAL